MPTMLKRRSKRLQVAKGHNNYLVFKARMDRKRESTFVGAPQNGVSPLTDDEWTVVTLYLALSARESQVARFVLDDITDADIATRLSISPHTVHAHFGRLYRKLQVHSRHQLIVCLFNAYVIQVHRRFIRPL